MKDSPSRSGLERYCSLWKQYFLSWKTCNCWNWFFIYLFFFCSCFWKKKIIDFI